MYKQNNNNEHNILVSAECVSFISFLSLLRFTSGPALTRSLSMFVGVYMFTASCLLAQTYLRQRIS